jgi:phosphate acetyltransferase
MAEHVKMKIIFPETADSRVTDAISIINDAGFCEACTLENFDDAVSTDTLAQHYLDKRIARGKTITFDEAKEKMQVRLFRAATLVDMDYADASIAGSISPSEEVIRAGIQAVGIADGVNIVSSWFLMEYKDKTIAFADCGVVQNPTTTQLAEIAVMTAANYERYTLNLPKIAMLSYSTHGSGGGDAVAKVRAAAAIVQEKIAEAYARGERMGSWLLDGEIQFDAAFDPSVACIKAPDSPLAGAANIFVFPDLSSGNIAYKIAERMGGATAIGPLIQGTRKPFMDLSRGCKVTDIVKMAQLLAASHENETVNFPPTPSPSHASLHQTGPLAS